MIDSEQVKAAYSAGRSTRQIAADLGCSHTTVHNVLAKSGVRYGRVPKATQLQMMAEDLESGMLSPRAESRLRLVKADYAGRYPLGKIASWLSSWRAWKGIGGFPTNDDLLAGRAVASRSVLADRLVFDERLAVLAG